MVLNRVKNFLNSFSILLKHHGLPYQSPTHPQEQDAPGQEQDAPGSEQDAPGSEQDNVISCHDKHTQLQPGTEP